MFCIDLVLSVLSPFQGKKALSVSDLQTVLLACVVRDTSGPRSANLSSRKDKYAPNTDEKGPMDWRYFSVVTAGKVSRVGYRKIIKPAIPLGFIPVRDIKPVFAGREYNGLFLFLFF